MIITSHLLICFSLWRLPRTEIKCRAHAWSWSSNEMEGVEEGAVYIQEVSKLNNIGIVLLLPSHFAIVTCFLLQLWLNFLILFSGTEVDSSRLMFCEEAWWPNGLCTGLQINWFGFEPDSDHCVVLVDMLFTHTVPLHPGVLLGTGDLNAGKG